MIDLAIIKTVLTNKVALKSSKIIMFKFKL